jgi:two-component system nitrogen regulation response regulator NtrX
MDEKILVVDDEDSIRTSLAGILEDDGFRVLFANDGVTALEVVKKELPDLVLLDIWMPRMDGIETLQKLKELYPALLVIMMSGHGTIETAVKSTKMGAYDFVEKPFSLEKLLLCIRNALGMLRLKDENESLRDLAFRDRQMTGTSPAMLKLKEQIKLVAPSNASVLITGENGTGKELVARALHRRSERENEVFISVDMGAIAESLFESELFGHMKGAFTDAKEDRPGRFELASGGTLFLDEIGNLSMPMQAKLLSVLEARKVTRLGSNVARDIDIRLICATNMPIYDMVAKNEFRQDLLYRINTVEIQLPPLRDRQEDIPLLVDHFLKIFSKKYQKGIKKVSPAALKKLERYQWPGNIRELIHTLERAVILAEAHVLQPGDFLFPEMEKEAEGVILDNYNLEAVEKAVIRKALKKYAGNVSHAAKELGLTRTSLYRRMEKYGL